MTSFFIIVCVISSLLFLILLAKIDLETRLLPNKYVLRFAICGVLFHSLSKFHFSDPQTIALGAIAGGGLLLVVRTIANRAYKKDTLGLGDVKLMAAAGLWLGIENIFLAIAIGAFAGLLHGLIYSFVAQKNSGEKINLATLSIPAGPGFIIGIVIAVVIKLQTLPQFLELL